MKNCEHFEILLSTWLDGPLEPPEQVECLDHLVRCASCRTFYADARALDGLVAAIRTPAGAVSPSPEVWKRIEWKTRTVRTQASRRALPAWALRAAAVVVVASGLAVALWKGGPAAPPPEQVDIQVGQGVEMTDTRFVELAKEVLQSDRRYQSAMYQIMEQVVRDTSPSREASSEGLLQRADEGDDREGVESPDRLPA